MVPAGTSFFTFAMVEERMIEALQLWRRMPDGDARFGLGGRISSIWRSFVRDREMLIAAGELVQATSSGSVPIRMRPTRDDVAAMEEASEWLLLAPERDRQIIVLALSQRAAGFKRVRWAKVREAMATEHGTRSLGMRYSRAITAIANALNKGSSAPKASEG